MLYWLACRYKQQSNNSTPEPVRLILAWEGDSPAFSMYIVTASFFHDPEQLPGWWDPTDPDPNPCGHWYPLISKGLGPGDLQILVTWYQSTPRNYSNWIQEERKKKTFQPTRLVQCMLDMWTPGSLANVKLRYLCSFLFFHESEFAPLRPLFIILHILSWDVRMFHAITSVCPKGNILHSIQKFVSSFSPSVTFNYLYVSDFSRFFMSILWMVEKSCNPP